MNEFEIIDIFKKIGRRWGRGVGIGDDAAVLGVGGLITCDTMVEGVHFDLGWMGLGDAAYRCLAANLSDIAAMGGKSGAYVLSLGVPWGRVTQKEIEEIAGGLRDAMEEHGVGCLVGGDTVKTPCWVMTITLLGEVGSGGAVLRSGAKEGDSICVFRGLGDAAAGLEWLRGGQRGGLGVGHCRPRAEVRLGEVLGDWGGVNGMLDISDGLGLDLGRMLGNSGGLGGEVWLGRVPVGEEAKEIGVRLGVEPWEWVVGGGEDYTLCAAVSPSRMEELRKIVGSLGREVFEIGRVLGRGEGLRWWDRDGKAYHPKSLGYVHGEGLG